MLGEPCGPDPPITGSADMGSIYTGPLFLNTERESQFNAEDSHSALDQGILTLWKATIILVGIKVYACQRRNNSQ